MQTPPDTDPFVAAFRGSFAGILRWPQLDALWETLRQQADDGWYIYAVGEPPPGEPASKAQLENFIQEIDALLRKEHDEDYCGIVYVDDPKSPSFIKIFDPDNLGVSCGFSEAPPLPGWILSRIPPSDLPAALPQPGKRRRWWRSLFPG